MVPLSLPAARHGCPEQEAEHTCRVMILCPGMKPPGGGQASPVLCVCMSGCIRAFGHVWCACVAEKGLQVLGNGRVLSPVVSASQPSFSLHPSQLPTPLPTTGVDPGSTSQLTTCMQISISEFASQGTQPQMHSKPVASICKNETIWL